jgi:hypothetical protein
MMNRVAALLLGLILALSVWTLWPKTGAAIINGAAAPEFVGENWLNSKPLTIRGLQGRVVLVEFWTYG